MQRCCTVIALVAGFTLTSTCSLAQNPSPRLELNRAGAPVPPADNGGAGFVPGIARLHLPDINLADSAVGVRMAAFEGRYQI
jgi:hypothetical protein